MYHFFVIWLLWLKMNITKEVSLNAVCTKVFIGCIFLCMKMYISRCLFHIWVFLWWTKIIYYFGAVGALMLSHELDTCCWLTRKQNKWADLNSYYFNRKQLFFNHYAFSNSCYEIIGFLIVILNISWYLQFRKIVRSMA